MGQCYECTSTFEMGRRLLLKLFHGWNCSFDRCFVLLAKVIEVDVDLSVAPSRRRLLHNGASAINSPWPSATLSLFLLAQEICKDSHTLHLHWDYNCTFTRAFSLYEFQHQIPMSLNLQFFRCRVA